MVGTIIEMYGAYRSGLNARIAARENSYNLKKIAKHNAKIAREEAAYNAAAVITQAKYDAAIANNNAKIANENSAQIRIAVGYEVKQLESQNRRRIAEGVAGYAKAGVDLEGTPEDVLYDSAHQAELDILAAKYIGAIEAGNFEYGADMSEYQGKVGLQVARKEAEMILWKGDMIARTTMLDAEAGIASYKREAKAATERANWSIASSAISAFSAIGGQPTSGVNRKPTFR